MSTVSVRCLTAAALACTLIASTAALAQQAPTAAPTAPPTAAPPAAPPAWQQGRTPEHAASTLHPFAPQMTGRPASELPVDKLTVPAGFKVEVWADGIPEARSLALGDKGTVFVSNRLAKNVYAVVERNGKREVKTILKGLNAPNGLAFNKGTLYVAERNRITRYDGIEDRLDNPPEGKVVIDGLDPTTQPGHFWKFLAVGPDGKLYFNIGSPQNITMPTYMQAVIMRVDPTSGALENYAQGVRNTVGFDWHPQTKQLWFTEHARDWISDDLPEDELNVVKHQGEHFGFPYCHQGDILDPEHGKNRSCSEFTPPVLKLGAHVAPLGMRFYTGTMFPAEYKNNIFIARHGSWNRTVKQGYDVYRVVLDGKGKVVKYEPFLSGFLVDEKADPPMWGRPVDVLLMKDGSLLVSDDYNGNRLPHQLHEVKCNRRGRGTTAAAAAFAVALPLVFWIEAAAGADLEAGRQKAQVCVACHGPAGNSINPVMPSLAGQPAQFISMELFQFREGNRKDPQMTPMAANLSNADMNDLAAYFTAQKAEPPAHKTDPANAAAGPQLAQQFNCVQCHGPALLGLQHIPRLAGQQYEYLKTQLRGFKAQTRADLDGNMTSAAQALTDKDIEVLVDYISGLGAP